MIEQVDQLDQVVEGAVRRRDPRDQTQLSNRVRRSLPALVPLFGILLLLIANRSLNNQAFTLHVGVTLGLGVATWFLSAGSTYSLRRHQSRSAPTDHMRRDRNLVRIALAVISGLAAVGAYSWAADNRFRTEGVVSWFVAVGVWLLVWWPGPLAPGQRVRRWTTWWTGLIGTAWKRPVDLRRLFVLLAVVVAVGLGAFFRLHDIAETPLDPTSDHAEKLLDVTDVLEGKRPIFFERNTGREPAQFYLTATLIRIFDLSVSFTTLKIGTALMGTLAIPFVYLLGAEIGGRLSGAIAALFYAVCAWPVEIARAGLRFAYAPVAAAASLWFLLRWMRTRDRKDALLCGLSIGIGLYGYTPIRVVVPALVVGMVIAFFDPARRSLRRAALIDSLLIGTTATMVFLPLGRYALNHPDMFWYRAAGRMTGETDRSAFGALIDNLSVFAQNNLNAALGFNWRGDSTFVNAVTDAPMLDRVTGALLIAGVVAVVVTAIWHSDLRATFIVLALPILLLSSTLAISFPNENPSVNREGPAAPLVFAVLALPLAHLYRQMRVVVGATLTPFLVLPLAGFLVGTAATLSYDEYFNDFDWQTRVAVANTIEIAEAIEGARSVGVDKNDAYIIDRAHWLDVRNIGIALGDIRWSDTHNIWVGDPLPDRLSDRPLFLIVHRDDIDRIAEIRDRYPDAIFTLYPSEVTWKAFVTVWIPGAESAPQ